MVKLLFLFFAILNYSNIQAQPAITLQKPISQNLLLHFNTSICNAGDTLQFKCYIINTIDHIQDDNNLYIVLSDKNGTLISKDKYPVVNSGAYGYIPIPKKLLSGTYTIEAFTPYMINNKMIKSNQIIVNNPFNQTDNNKLDCKVYLDNNRLVSNIPNTFFVKTSYANNIPAAAEVFITDKNNKEQYRFKTDVNGIGKVTFKPLNNQLYNLNINGPDKIYQFPLAKADSMGINMLIAFDKNILNFTVNKNYKIQNSQDSFTLVAYQKNKQVYKLNFSFENYATVTGGLHIESLHTGVAKLMLINKGDVVIATTSVYLQNDHDFEEVLFKNSTGTAQNKSHFDISFANKANRFFSVAVEKINAADTVVNADCDFDFFFTNMMNAPEADQVVDFYQIASLEKNGLADKYKILGANFKTLPDNAPDNRTWPPVTDEYATIIRGKVYDNKNEKLFANGILNFFYEMPDTTFNYNASVNSDGSFVLDSLIFSGAQKFYYRYFDTKNNEVSCTIKLAENKNNKILDSLLVYRFNYKTGTKPEVEQAKDVKPKTMEAVKVKTESKSKEQNVNDLYATGIYSGPSSSFIDNINNPPTDGAMSGTEFIKNRIQNIAFQNGNIVNTRNFSLSNGQYWIVGIVINESPASVSDLSLLTAKNIALVKFFDVGHVAAGSVNPGGLIAVYTMGNTSKYTNGGSSVNKNTQVFEYEGFSNNVTHTINNAESINKKLVAYWNPTVILRNGQNNFSFDIEKPEPGKAHKLVVRGYNEAGQLINFETILKN